MKDGLRPGVERQALGQQFLKKLLRLFRTENEVLATQEMDFGPFILLVEKQSTDVFRANKPWPCTMGVIHVDEFA